VTSYKDEKDCPGCKEAATWRKLVGQLRIIDIPGHYVYDGATKKNIYIQPVFFSYIDYGITSRWFGK
jgi:hypothetical protein